MTWVVEEDLALKEFKERWEDGFKRRKLNLYDTHGVKGKGNNTTLGKSGPREEDFIRRCESFLLA
jgi:hypothetical protein